MAANINGIPVFDALIGDEDTGMFKISLVDDPAVMSNFQAFDNKQKVQLYAVQDEEKRLVFGVVMRADFPIYRYDEKFGEYYIVYRADTIRAMAEKYLLESRQNDVNLMHEDGSDVEGVQMVQYFIKDSEKGVAPAGFDDIADGSLFAEFHVVNDDVWEEIKNGTYKGFSLEGVFDLERDNDQDDIDSIVDALDGAFSRIFKHSNINKMSKKLRLARFFAKVMAELASVTTDKGILKWDGDEDLKAGDNVYFEDEDGNRTAPEDGDYKTEDGKVIVVADGKVSEIKDDAAEVADQFGSKATDKGELSWEGEEDLKAGDAMFVKNEDGENVPAPDGDYKTEDKKIIKVADGKVTEIVDDEAEVAPTEDDVNARKASRFARLKALFEESYEEKTTKIIDAIMSFGIANFYIYECGDDYAIICYWEDDYADHYKRFDITFDADGNAVASNPVDVVREFVPDGDQTPSAEEFSKVTKEKENLVAENEALKAKVTELERKPMANSAHEQFNAYVASKTGVKGKDRLAQMFQK